MRESALNDHRDGRMGVESRHREQIAPRPPQGAATPGSSIPAVSMLLVLFALAVFALPGCTREAKDTPPSSPVTAAPSPVATVNQPTDSAPAIALRRFWRERDARKWESAHAFLSKDSRAALPEPQLAEEAVGTAPTQASGAAWAALFSRDVSSAEQRLPTVEELEEAKVEVATPTGPGMVRMIREGAHWKIDLLQTLSSGP